MHVRRGKASAAEDQADDGLGQRNHRRGGQQAQSGHARDRVRNANGKLEAFSLGPELGKEGQRGHARGHREHRHGRGEELFGVVEPSDVSGTAGGVKARKILVKEGQSKAKHQRQRHLQPDAQAGVMKVDPPAVAHSRANRSQRVEDKRSQKKSGGCADGQRGDPQPAGQQQTASNDAEVVDNRLKCLVEILLAHQQRSAENAARKEKDLRRQQKPRHVRAKHHLRGGKAGISEADVRSGKKDKHDGGCGEHQHHQVEDGEEHPFALGLFVALPIAVEDGDKGDGDGSANQKVVHQVGQAKGRHVGIGLRPRAKEPCNEFAASEADEARYKRGCRQQDTGRKRRMSVRWTQHTQRARPPGLRRRGLRQPGALSCLPSCHWIRFYRDRVQDGTRQLDSRAFDVVFVPSTSVPNWNHRSEFLLR